MDKAPDAFRTISEVAEEINVPQHVLRFWESRFAQIRPMKRGGGRRYYRPDDVDLLRGVRHLLYGEGYTIRGVQRILREEGISFVQGVWRPGSAAPRSNSDDDRAGDDGAERQPGKPSNAEPSPLGAASRVDDPFSERAAHGHEAAVIPPPAPARPQQLDLKGDDRRKLQTVLDDLIACHRLINAALSEDYADEAAGRGGEI